MEQSIEKSMAAQAIGMEVIRYLESKGSPIPETESGAVKTLEEIRRIVDDVSLSDEECFRRIEAIIRVLAQNGIHTVRHDW